ncbi:MAG TPA: methyltransferase domain-containing protein [Candidatus Dormibacteraeota bacterium]|jgi:magnesium-protoporphyrin O-methyltransferase
MGNCCTPKGYRWIFSEKKARSEARRYRSKGLDPTSRRIADLLKQQGLKGRTLLEVGGGVGGIQIELVKAGLSRAVSIELTPTYEEAALTLLRQTGLEDRIERRVVDFAEAASDVEAADIVIMNRVICCYPDMPKLAGAAADHTRDVLVLSFPREGWWMRIGLSLGNLVLRLARRQFQVFLHSPETILATVERHGLKATFNQRGLFWQVAALRRTAPIPGEAGNHLHTPDQSQRRLL